MIQALKGLAGRVRRSHTDAEVVKGLQHESRSIEEWFYHKAETYFNAHFNEVFFDKDMKQEIFQTAFLKLWTEIHNGKITTDDETLVRQQRDGAYRPMTCSLTTFLMTFAKNEYREVARNRKEDGYDELFEDAAGADVMVTSFDEAEDVDTVKNRIVDECISQMPPRCLEVLTLFYYEGKSLDEIMALRGDKNTSKNGLKSAKNKCMTTLRERVTAEFKRYNIVA